MSLVSSLALLVCLAAGLLGGPGQQHHQSTRYQPSTLGRYGTMSLLHTCTSCPADRFPRAAVAVDGLPCAGAAREVLQEGGTAVDAAVAGMFCNGVYNSQSMGIGGGFMMTIYKASTGTAATLDARETAPAAAHEKMFSNKWEPRYGGKAVSEKPFNSSPVPRSKQRWRRINSDSIQYPRKNNVDICSF